jgi:hypothetical protein
MSSFKKGRHAHESLPQRAGCHRFGKGKLGCFVRFPRSRKKTLMLDRGAISAAANRERADESREKAALMNKLPSGRICKGLSLANPLYGH